MEFTVARSLALCRPTGSVVHVENIAAVIESERLATWEAIGGGTVVATEGVVFRD
jgi:hypothetical protein